MTPPVFIKLWRTARLVLGTLVGLFALAVLLELARAVALLHRIHPIVAYVALAVLAVTMLVLLTVWTNRWLDAHVLIPPEGADEGARSHRDLVTGNRFLVKRLKRMADHPLYTEAQQKHLRQVAYQVEEMLGHHPLQDDLERSLAATRADTLEPAHAVLRGHAETFARERMRRVVNDVVEPPFPTHSLLTIYGHQLVMITRIVDLYLPRAGLLEYARVVMDVCRVIYEGQFFKLGQTLFAGVYSNSPPLGRAADSLGQALTTIWLTRTVSRAAILRCEDVRYWTVERAVADLDACVLDLLADSKECLLQDVLPLLKLSLRHQAPAGVTDVTAFSSGVIEGLARAIDAAVRMHKSQPTAVATARRTINGEDAAPAPVTAAAAPPPESHEHRRRRHRSRQGFGRVLYVFMQRIKYTVGRPR